MTHTKPKRTTWTHEAAQADALKYQTRTDWAKGKQSSYGWAYKHGLIDQFCGHMPVRVPSRKLYWTLERCKEDALQYTSRNEWQLAKGNGYLSARTHGWVDECCAHMPVPTKKTKWSYAELMEDALKYESKADWRRKSTAYQTARRRGILDECCAHMKKTNHTLKDVTWTKGRCIFDALRFTTVEQWKSSTPDAYNTAKDNDWLADCCEHMPE